MQLLLLMLPIMALLAGCHATPCCNETTPMHPCAWLAGTWVMHGPDDGDAMRVVEHWLAFTEDGSVGVNRTTSNGDTVFFEFLRIASDEQSTVYLAQPAGRSPATRFTMIEHDDNRVVFENPSHDFPQRIIYVRHGETLTARIEGMQDGKARSEQWIYRRTH